MAKQRIQAEILLRRDTLENWTTVNPVLSSGQIGYITDTGKMKIGDGVKTFTALDYYIPEAEIEAKIAAAAGDALPEVTSDDNGKVLKVIEGEWGVGSDAQGASLPSVSSTDNGKILKVANGEWSKGDAPRELPQALFNGSTVAFDHGTWKATYGLLQEIDPINWMSDFPSFTNRSFVKEFVFEGQGIEDCSGGFQAEKIFEISSDLFNAIVNAMQADYGYTVVKFKDWGSMTAWGVEYTLIIPLNSIFVISEDPYNTHIYGSVIENYDNVAVHFYGNEQTEKYYMKFTCNRLSYQTF